MTRKDWTVSIYAGAIFGGVFWFALPMATSLSRSDPSRHAAFTTVVVAIVVSGFGFTWFVVANKAPIKRFGATVGIGALIGLPILAWFALW